MTQKMTVRQRPTFQENLVSLYLRLNGFFVTSLIVHSSIHGRNQSEVDALALRLPFSAEPEREIGPDPILDLSTTHTDLAICEVKSRGQSLQFNDGLVGSPNGVATVLRWAGFLDGFEVNELIGVLRDALSPQSGSADIPTVIGPRGLRIRGLLFCPERNSRRVNQPWFVTGPTIMEYVWRCLCPPTPRPLCATNYDFKLWGDHEPIIRYFKFKGVNGPGGIDELYKFVEINSK